MPNQHQPEGLGAACSIPYVAFIPFDAMFSKEFSKFFLKRLDTMMFLLPIDVVCHLFDV